MGIGTRNHHFTCFNRLAQGFQDVARKFRKLIHKQDSIVRQGDLPRFCTATSADDRGHGGGAMGLSKWPLARDSPLIEQPGQGMDHRGFKRFGRAERR